VIKEFRREVEKLQIKAGLLEGQVSTRSRGRSARDVAQQGRSTRDATGHDDGPAQRFVMLLNAPVASSWCVGSEATQGRRQRLTAEANAEALTETGNPWRRVARRF